MTDIPQARRSPMEHERDAGGDLIARVKAVMEGPETVEMLVFHLRNMADSAFADQIDADRVNRAADLADAARTLVPDLLAALKQAQAQNRELALQCLAIDGQAGEALDRAARAEAEAERLRGDNADLRDYVVPLLAIHAVEQGKGCGWPEGHIHPQHYDKLKSLGARMDSFTRAALTKGTDHD